MKDGEKVRVTCRAVVNIKLELVEMSGERRQPQTQQIPEHSHIHRQASQIVGEVTIRQNSLNEV